MRGELLAENVEGTLNIQELRVLGNDVALGVGLDKTTRGGAHSTAHVGDQEATVRLGTDLISDGAEESTVAVGELGLIRVGSVKVVGSILGLQQRQETATNKELAIDGGAKMVGGVAAGGHVGDGNEGSEGVLRIGKLDLLLKQRGTQTGYTHIIERDGRKEILVVVVASTRPEITDLLGLDVGNLERRGLQRRGRGLEDGQRGQKGDEGISDSRDGRDQRWQRELRILLLKIRAAADFGGRAGDMGDQGAQESGGGGSGDLHAGQARGSTQRY